MVQPAFNDEDIYQTDLPIGEILRRARTHYNQSLTDVENNIRIRASQIDAIEKGDFEKIPGRVYAIGFVRSYSEYLGLDGDKMVKLFKMQYGGGRVMKPELNFPVTNDEIRIAPPWLIGVCVVGVLLIIALWWAWQGDDRAQPEEIPTVASTIETPAPEETAEAPAESFGPPAPAADAALAVEEITVNPDEAAAPLAQPSETPATTEEAVAAKKTTILNIVQNSWVEIKDQSGKTLVSRVLQAGDRYFVPDSPDLLMSLGNSGGVEIIVDGVKLKPLGPVGQVQRNISLDAASLKKNYGAQP